MFCTNCGAQVDDGLAFCTNCGAPMNSGAGQAQAQPAAQQPQYAQPAGQQPQYAQPQYAQPVGQASSPKSKVAAGLLAIFLGAWGIHKFYLGYGKEGGIMLGIWFVGFLLCFFGIGFIIVLALGVVALIEGIIYLTKSDEEFNRIYVQGKKPWF